MPPLRGAIAPHVKAVTWNSTGLGQSFPLILGHVLLLAVSSSSIDLRIQTPPQPAPTTLDCESPLDLG